ncbi:MAG TPA: preprotein translocase subunit SecG [Bauldia sp.]|nr:preprotein translocase subunit SecG [Bauldia sp.]
MDAIGNVIIVIHLMVVVALIAVVLLQRSEGGALGIGGSNAFLSSRGQGNVLTRATGILAAVFFATSIAMTVISRMTAPPSSILDTVPAAAPAAPAASGTTTAPATGGAGGIKGQLDRYLNGASTSTGNPVTDGTTPPPAAGSTAPADTGAGSDSTTTPPADSGTTQPAPQAPTSQ